MKILTFLFPFPPTNNLGGELFEQILKRGRFEETEASVITSQILNAVSYLHSNNIIHRDIKPENILLKGGEEMIVKVSDFGVAKELPQSSDGRGRAFSNVGTDAYLAPEVWKSGFGKKADVWSVGVVVRIMLWGAEEERDDMSVVSAEARDFVRRLCERDVDRRT